MANRKDTKDDDSELFKKAMQGVKPLKQTNIISQHRPPKTKVQRKTFEEKLDLPYLSDHCHEHITADQSLFYAAPGVQKRYLRLLKAGKICVEAKIDLHGTTIDEARSQLVEFLRYAAIQQFRCIRIVHGKGYRSANKYPKLKNHLYAWLKQLPEVLAFCSCQPKDGGTGAVYVLVKKSEYMSSH